MQKIVYNLNMLFFYKEEVYNEAIDYKIYHRIEL